MIKIALNNYKKYIAYFLVVFVFFSASILICYLAFMLGVFYPLNNYANGLGSSVAHYIAQCFTQMKTDFFLTSNFFKSTGQGAYQMIESIPTALKATVLLFLALSFGGFLLLRELGEWICRKNIRKKYEDSDSVTGFLSFLVRSIISLSAMALYALLIYVWSYAIFLVPVLSAVVGTIKDILTAYFIYFKKYRLKSLLNAKDIKSIFVVQIFSVIGQYIAIFLGLLHLSTFYLLLIILPIMSYTSVIINTASLEYFSCKQKKGQLLLKKLPVPSTPE